MSKSNEEILAEFKCALSSIKAHLDRNKGNSDLDDLREALGMRRKDKEIDNE